MVAEHATPDRPKSPAPEQDQRRRSRAFLLLGGVFGAISIWAALSDTLRDAPILRWPLVYMPWLAVLDGVLSREDGYRHPRPGSLLVGILLSWSVYLMSNAAWDEGLQEWWYAIPFEPVAWEQNAEVVAGWDVRGRMAVDLVSSDRLQGLRKQEVQALLGPGELGAKSLSFAIEGAGSRFDDCYGYLVIRMDDSGRVSACEIECISWYGPD